MLLRRAPVPPLPRGSARRQVVLLPGVIVTDDRFYRKYDSLQRRPADRLVAQMGLAARSGNRDASFWDAAVARFDRLLETNTIVMAAPPAAREAAAPGAAAAGAAAPAAAGADTGKVSAAPGGEPVPRFPPSLIGAGLAVLTDTAFITKATAARAIEDSGKYMEFYTLGALGAVAGAAAAAVADLPRGWVAEAAAQALHASAEPGSQPARPARPAQPAAAAAARTERTREFAGPPAASPESAVETLRAAILLCSAMTAEPHVAFLRFAAEAALAGAAAARAERQGTVERLERLFGQCFQLVQVFHRFGLSHGRLFRAIDALAVVVPYEPVRLKALLQLFKELHFEAPNIAIRVST